MDAVPKFNNVHTIIFDIDGTLAETDDYMIASIIQQFRKVVPFLKPRNLVGIVRFLVMTGETIAGLFYWLLDLLSLDHHFSRISNQLANEKESYRYGMVKASPQVIEELSNNYNLAICTAGGALSAALFLRKYNLEKVFQVVVTAETCNRTKPSPLPLLYISEILSTPVENCLMVGDTIFDLIAAKRAGIRFIGVRSGFDSPFLLKLSGADLIIDSVADLPALLATGIS
jgi:HAD superfamily hydrolase (TIGR01549 family)